jgi:hypothetical protein
MDYQVYLNLINEKCDEAMKHPLVFALDDSSKSLFRIAFLNGCHAMNRHYEPIVEDLQSQVDSYVEQENGEST